MSQISSKKPSFGIPIDSFTDFEMPGQWRVALVPPVADRRQKVARVHVGQSVVSTGLRKAKNDSKLMSLNVRNSLAS